MESDIFRKSWLSKSGRNIVWNRGQAVEEDKDGKIWKVN